ncbi:MAG: cytochrome c oxidase assembly protein [Actinobacteria bacterium]|nr:cytochrome c oxidase assembly protein [Actinomycetota bacterium]
MDHGATWPGFVVLGVGLAICSLGVSGYLRLIARTRSPRRERWFLRLLAWLGAWALVAACLLPPLRERSMDSLPWHMAVHIALMFLLPWLLVLAAPRVPLALGFAVRFRRRLLRFLVTAKKKFTHPMLGGLMASTLATLLLLNGVMVFWHLRAIYDWASTRMWAHQLLMAPSFLLSGWCFWRLILGSHPRPARASMGGQVTAILVTALCMLILAITMGVMAAKAWYAMDVSMLGETQALEAQRRAAGILWVCGDLWAIPSLAVLGWRLASERNGFAEGIEARLRRGPSA